MITIRYWELALIFLAGIGFWHLAMGVVYPYYGALLDLYIARQKAKAAEYEAACASEPPSVDSVERSVDTVHIGQIVPVPRQREQVDLPAASGPVAYGDAPLFDTLAMPLPPFDIDYSFVFGAPSWSSQTGAFPVVDVAPRARDRFTVKAMPEAPAELVEVA